MNNHCANENHARLLSMLQHWLCSQGLTGVCLLTASVISLYGYALLYAADVYSAYTKQNETHSLEIREWHLTELTRQIEQLELDVKQRREILSKTYNRVLHREGRLSEPHIISPTASRLVSESHAGGKRVNRSLVRYSPYQFDVTLPSAVTAYEMEQALVDTGLAGLGRSFVKAELTYGINAMFLAALAVHESHWGNSQLARDKHNLFGFGAHDADPYQGAAAFASKSECIMTVTRFIREQYIEGQLGRGRSITAINYNYASDTSWGEKVFSLMLQLDEMIQQSADNRTCAGDGGHFLR